MNKLTKAQEKIYEESGQGLVWAEFVEVGCPAKKEDYFITEREVLNLDIVKSELSKQKKEIIELFEMAIESRDLIKKGKIIEWNEFIKEMK